MKVEDGVVFNKKSMIPSFPPKGTGPSSKIDILKKLFPDSCANDHVVYFIIDYHCCVTI